MRIPTTRRRQAPEAGTRRPGPGGRADPFPQDADTGSGPARGGRRAGALEGVTGGQRVFLGWAEAWREKYRDECLRVIVTSNEHSPAMYRGSNPLTNIDAFYEAFGVKAGDKMFRKPEDRVRIW